MEYVIRIWTSYQYLVYIYTAHTFYHIHVLAQVNYLDISKYGNQLHTFYKIRFSASFKIKIFRYYPFFFLFLSAFVKTFEIKYKHHCQWDFCALILYRSDTSRNEQWYFRKLGSSLHICSLIIVTDILQLSADKIIKPNRWNVNLGKIMMFNFAQI